MASARAPYQNYRRYYRRNRERRERQSRSLHRKYYFSGAKTALFTLALIVIAGIVALYFTSLGLSAIGDFFGGLSR